jgi:hypothetical protein
MQSETHIIFFGRGTFDISSKTTQPLLAESLMVLFQNCVR